MILKVGSDFIATSADWNRSLVANRGKPVQVTILRDKKQQTLTLQVDSKHQKGALEQENLLGPGDEEMMAELGTGLNAAIDQQLAGEISAQAAAAAQAARAQAEALRDEMARMRLGVSPEAAEQLRQQAEKLRESMKAFQADPQQMQEMQRQMEEFRQQMEEFRARIEGRFV